MQRFTAERTAQQLDEIWLLEHPPVFTQGQGGKAEHILHSGSIPVVQSDRGGQVTYHGPGQLIVYLLLDIKRKQWGIKQLVAMLEDSVIQLLANYAIIGERKQGAPGVYVADKKIAALGLRVRRGCCFHGLSLNVDMDLAPFNGINPCGYKNLAVTQLKDLSGPVQIALVGHALRQILTATLGFQRLIYQTKLPAY
jgi:lipoyl(octanoyl) transferase